MIIRHLSLVLGSVLLLAACAAPAPQEFAVSQPAVVSPPGTLFRANDPNVNDVLAKGFCADGYQKLDESTLPTDSGDLKAWRVQCAPRRTFLIF